MSIVFSLLGDYISKNGYTIKKIYSNELLNTLSYGCDKVRGCQYRIVHVLYVVVKLV